MRKSKICTRCKKQKSLKFFAKRKKRLDWWCKSCHVKSASRYRNKINYRKYCKNRHQERIKVVIEYLLKHPCIDCGNTDIRVLDFDHVRGKKFKTISGLLRDNYSVKRIMSEIEKCEIRCANCHRIKSLQKNNSYKHKIVEDLLKSLDHKDKKDG